MDNREWLAASNLKIASSNLRQCVCMCGAKVKNPTNASHVSSARHKKFIEAMEQAPPTTPSLAQVEAPGPMDVELRAHLLQAALARVGSGIKGHGAKRTAFNNDVGKKSQCLMRWT